MEIHSIIVFLIVGVLAGWIAGKITKGRGFGLLGNMLVGVVGAFAGFYIFSLLGIMTTGTIGLLVSAIVGAVVLVFIVSLIRKVTK